MNKREDIPYSWIGRIVKMPIVAKPLIRFNAVRSISMTFFPQKYKTNPKMHENLETMDSKYKIQGCWHKASSQFQICKKVTVTQRD